MAIDTYGNLQTAIASRLHRADLTSAIPDFIALAEANIRTDVRCRAMEAESSGTLTAAEVDFPTRFAEARRVLLNDYPLEYVTPEVFYPYRQSSSGKYTIVGQQFVFQATSGTYQIDHYAWFAPFSDEGDTNWLLTNHPNIYFFGSLVEAADHIGKDSTQWAVKYQAAIAKLVRSEQRFTGPLRVRPDIRVA